MRLRVAASSSEMSSTKAVGTTILNRLMAASMMRMTAMRISVVARPEPAVTPRHAQIMRE
jgi:hypothetical protein